MRILLPLIVLLTLCGFTVHDGDTITGIRYRLAYIDAPELKQTCHINGRVSPIGKQSQERLEQLSRNHIDECRIIDVDRYGRAVADCQFNMYMVRDGLAVCYDKYINDASSLRLCHMFQDYAKSNKLGVWACDDFVEPWVWRKRK